MIYEDYIRSCYMFARYQEYYRQNGLFERKLTELLVTDTEATEEEKVLCLEKMISHGDLFLQMEEDACPVLIFTGAEECYGIFDWYAKSLGNALQEIGENVEFYDLAKDGTNGLGRFVGQRFRAIIGFQSMIFHLKLSDGTVFLDTLLGGKYNVLTDNPLTVTQMFDGGPKDYYILTHDPQYVKNVNTYYIGRATGVLWMPGGEEFFPKIEFEKKEYDFSFVGTYHDWRQWINAVWMQNRKDGGLTRRYLSYMCHHPDETWEEGLHNLLSTESVRRKYNDTEKDIPRLLTQMSPVMPLVMYYFREKILDTIVEANIHMHVFGQKWYSGRYASAANLIRHKEKNAKDIPEVYANSKVSLNIMSWHKNGMTERLANMLINHAVVVTDQTSYMDEHYRKGEEYVGFSLTEISRLPMMLHELLRDPDRQKKIAETAYSKALHRETWEERAKDLKRIIKKNEKNG